MSGYVQKITVRKDFEGDIVVVTLRPMGWIDKLNIDDLIPPETTGKTPARTRTKEENRAITDVSIQTMAKYVESVSGLRDASGAEVSIEALTTTAYFFDLSTTIFADWYGASRVKDPTLPAVDSSDISTASA